MRLWSLDSRLSLSWLKTTHQGTAGPSVYERLRALEEAGEVASANLTKRMKI